MEPVKKDPLRIQAMIVLGFLVIQYALGMTVALFVTYPDGIKGGTAWEFSWRQPVLAAHITIGILLGLAAIVFIIRAFRAPDPRWKAPSLLGILGIFAAAMSGSAFIPSQMDIYSYFMSLSFLLAFFAYLWGLFRTHHQEQLQS